MKNFNKIVNIHGLQLLGQFRGPKNIFAREHYDHI